MDVAENVLCPWQRWLPSVIDGWSMQSQSRRLVHCGSVQSFIMHIRPMIHRIHRYTSYNLFSFPPLIEKYSKNIPSPKINSSIDQCYQCYNINPVVSSNIKGKEKEKEKKVKSYRLTSIDTVERSDNEKFVIKGYSTAKSSNDWTLQEAT